MSKPSSIAAQAGKGLLALVVLVPFAQITARALVAQTYADAEITSSTGLTLIPATLPEFTALVEKRFPGLTAMPGFAKAQPYMVLLRNDSGQTVKGYSVRFDYASKPEFPAFGSYANFLFDPLSEIPSLDNNGEPFGPGTVRLLAPGYLTESPALYLRTVAHNRWAIPLIANRPMDTEHGEVTPFAQVSVDAVIYADHHMRGADQSRLMERYTARRDARRAEQAKVKELLSGASSHKELTTILLSHQSSGFATHQNPTPDNDLFYKQQYDLQTGLESGRLHRVLKGKGLPTLQHHLNALLQQPAEVNVRD